MEGASGGRAVYQIRGRGSDHVYFSMHGQTVCRHGTMHQLGGGSVDPPRGCTVRGMMKRAVPCPMTGGYRVGGGRLGWPPMGILGRSGPLGERSGRAGWGGFHASFGEITVSRDIGGRLECVYLVILVYMVISLDPCVWLERSFGQSMVYMGGPK